MCCWSRTRTAIRVTPASCAPPPLRPPARMSGPPARFNAENLFDAVDDDDGDMGDWAPASDAAYRANVASGGPR